MPEELFSDNLLRMIGAVLYDLATLQTAKEMYGKSYFALGAGEKAVVDQTVFATVAGNYAAITPESLKAQTQTKAAGFQPPKAP